MAYKSLYRVYRPQTFAEVAGQKAITTTLQHAIDENRIAHAYLFCGPRGTGKTSVAKLLAKAVNCTSEHRPCGQCESCKAIEYNNHPDIIEIDAATNNGVDEVRELIDRVKFAPTSGRYKVYIIDEVHMMSNAAFNALLKTLEEPPEHVIFILATTQPQSILPTIISRCQRFDFNKLSMEDIIERMRYIIKQEDYKVDEDALELIAKLSDGGMRDALSILEQALAYNPDHLMIDDVYKIYGMISMEDKISFIKVLLSKNMTKALSLLEEFNNKGIDIKKLTMDLIDILKDIIIYKNTENIETLSVLSSYTIDQISPYITVEECFDFIDLLMKANEQYAYTLNPGIYFELTVLKICNKVSGEKKAIEVDEENDSEEVIENEEVIEEIPDILSEEETVEEISSINKNINVEMDDILNILVQAKREILNEVKEKWQVIRRYQANLNTAKYATMLVNSTPVAACKGGLIIAFEYMPDVNAANYYKNYPMLSQFISELLSEDYKYIAVESEEWISIRAHYIQLMKAHQLPAPREITLKHIEEVDEEDHLNDAQKLAYELFGDIVEIEE